MARAHIEPWGGVRRVAEENPQLLDDLRELVKKEGPIRANETGHARPPRTPGEMWNWHVGKTLLEYLFFAGEVTAARRVNFERLYDIPERVLPLDILDAPTPAPEDAQRELIRRAARACGIGTEPDLRDYFRMSHSASKRAVAELVEAGELAPVEVAGWSAPAYVWHEARRPRRINARALLSPFDPVVWFRERTERLFGFHYRIEIYTPAPKRQYGYYVLPFLLDDALVARVDLKADRQAGVLRVQSAWLEAGAPSERVAGELAAELGVMAQWLELDGVVVMPRGDLAAVLQHAVA